MSDLADALSRAWDDLEAGVADGAHPMRIVALATTGPDGAEARYVGLRHADRIRAVVAVHTDLLTPKVAELRADPRCTLLAWNPVTQVQLRLKGAATVHHGAEVAALWDAVPPEGRRNYGTRPDPGLPIPDPTAYAKPAVQDRFAVISCRIDRIDLVDLNDPHRRALFDRADGFTGQWLAP